jgi:hypothetical protein
VNDSVFGQEIICAMTGSMYARITEDRVVRYLPSPYSDCRAEVFEFTADAPLNRDVMRDAIFKHGIRCPSPEDVTAVTVQAS